MQTIPLLCVVGPTACGKTRLGVELALRHNGEVVSADSQQIYRHMDIGTAKATEEEMRGVPHHLLDFLEPDEPFSVAQYVARAHTCIADIHARGRLPVLVGGTGLYVSSLIDNLTFDEEPADPALREALYAEAREKGNAQLLCRLRTVDPETAAGLHENNLGRIVRALEIFEKTGKTMAWHKEQSRRNPSPYRLCMLGLTCRDRRILYDRIDARVDAMMETGLLDETRRLLAQYGEQKMLAAIGYKELAGYLQGKTPLCDAVAYLKQQTRRYAKRQLTWFQKDARITWIYIDEQPGLNAIIEKAEEQIQNEKLL